MARLKLNKYLINVATAALLAGGISATSIAAQEVTLRSSDGAINMTGDLIEFVDNTYVLQTELGSFRVSAARVFCEGGGCPEDEDVRADVILSGSSTIADGFMSILLSGYAAQLGAAETVTSQDGATEDYAVEMVGEDGFGDPVGSFMVRSSIASDAFANLLGKSADIGMSSRRISTGEIGSLSKYGAGSMIDPNNEHILAADSLVVITHPDNPVGTLTMDQLRGVFSGTIVNWSEVGGNNAPITVVQFIEGSGTRAVFEDRLFGGAAPSAPTNQVTAENGAAVSDLVNEDPNVIGVVSYAFQRGAQPVDLVNECGITMVPDAFSARTEEYALQRFLYLYTRGDSENEFATSFIDYVRTGDADQIIGKSGFIDLGVIRQEQGAGGSRADQLRDARVADAVERSATQNILPLLDSHDRLSSTFRFTTGSRNLTPRGELNLGRLASYLEGQPAGTKIKFVGFTDSVGASNNNLDLSIGRANQVMASVQQSGGDRLNGIEMEAIGFGEIAPAGCNETDDGRSINRRVEVWIEAANG